MAKKADGPSGTRVPAAVGAIPLVGGLAKQADAQVRWMQTMIEQNARLIGQFPATLKSFNDSIERFNQTIGRLDSAVARFEAASQNLDRLIGLANDLPGAAILRRIAAGRGEEDVEIERPKRRPMTD